MPPVNHPKCIRHQLDVKAHVFLYPSQSRTPGITSEMVMGQAHIFGGKFTSLRSVAEGTIYAYIYMLLLVSIYQLTQQSAPWSTNNVQARNFG